MKRLVQIVAWLAFSTICFADVKIDCADRVPNTTIGHCLWASVETCGNYYGLDEFHGLVQRHISELDGARPLEAMLEIRRMHAHYTWYSSSNFDTIKWYTDQGIPVVIGFKHTSIFGAHAVVVVDVTDTTVKLIDSNLTCVYWIYDRDMIEEAHHGWALAVFP